MANQSNYQTSDVKTANVAQAVAQMRKYAQDKRLKYERRWYDNNFFDDGYHFRHVSRTTGRIVDAAGGTDLWSPKRAVPKASRQIRGIANLLMSFDYHPTVYPVRIDKLPYLRANAKAVGLEYLDEFTPELPDPETGEMIPNQWFEDYKKAKHVAKERALRIGQWIESEWDEQNIIEQKLPLMVLLAAKNSISYIQIWGDPVEEKIVTPVYDAFDIYLLGNYDHLQNVPFIGKVIPKTIREIKANEFFDELQREKINPDNRFASSEIKEAYMESKFGSMTTSDSAATLLQHEWYLKETLDDNNWSIASKQEDADIVMKGKNKGDTVIRQVFTAGDEWLSDKYLPLSMYPFVDFRFEPGSLYQVPQIERFIDANKSLDIIVSRMERMINTMNVGVWLKKQGEQFKINNAAGGQVISYKNTPPRQADITPVPAHVFNHINLLESIIEEQGVTTTALGKLPSGVKANAAIETLKASEFANLTIPINMLKDSVQRITEQMIMMADTYFVSEKEVEILDAEEPEYFNIIGSRGVELRKKIKEEVRKDTIVLNNKTRVRIDIETGAGYTIEGKRENMLQLGRFIGEMFATGAIEHPAVKVALERILETWQFGSVGEFMQGLEDGQVAPQQQDDIKQQMKEAVLEVIADLQGAGQPTNSPMEAPDGSIPQL